MVLQINKQERHRLVSTKLIHNKIISVRVFPLPFPERHLPDKYSPVNSPITLQFTSAQTELGILSSGFR